jgi:hypothetical protein
MIGRLISRLWPQLDRLADAMHAWPCMWCCHPEAHDHDTGCQHPGCGCTDLL